MGQLAYGRPVHSVTSINERIPVLVALADIGSPPAYQRYCQWAEKCDFKHGTAIGNVFQYVSKLLDGPADAVGFGISMPEQASQVGALADGVIVGSVCEDNWRE